MHVVKIEGGESSLAPVVYVINAHENAWLQLGTTGSNRAKVKLVLLKIGIARPHVAPHVPVTDLTCDPQRRVTELPAYSFFFSVSHFEIMTVFFVSCTSLQL